MMKRSPSAFMLFIFFLTVLLAPSGAAAAGQPPRKVLLLTSHHQGDRWNDSVVQGVREAMGSIENLGMRRYTDQDQPRMITEYIQTKYQGRPQELVLKLFPQTTRIMAAVSERDRNGVMRRGRLILMGPHCGIATGERLCG